MPKRAKVLNNAVRLKCQPKADQLVYHISLKEEKKYLNILFKKEVLQDELKKLWNIVT